MGQKTPKVVFSTKCFRGDYKKFLRGAYKRKLNSIPYPFDETWLILNNEVPKYAKEQLKKLSGADKVFDVYDYIDDALLFFNLKREDFAGGLWYSIAELVELYLAGSFDYLCHLSSDSLIIPPSDWVSEGIQAIKEDVATVAPKSDCNTWGEYDQLFSDQGYLVLVDEFRQQIYNYKQPVLEQYPPHGGDSFERLVGRYLHNSGRKRRILNEHYLAHEAY